MLGLGGPSVGRGSSLERTDHFLTDLSHRQLRHCLCLQEIAFIAIAYPIACLRGNGPSLFVTAAV